jgi:hypothetical protein
MVALVCYVTAFTRASGSGSKVQNQSMALPSFVYIFLGLGLRKLLGAVIFVTGKIGGHPTAAGVEIGFCCAPVVVVDGERFRFRFFQPEWFVSASGSLPRRLSMDPQFSSAFLDLSKSADGQRRVTCMCWTYGPAK